MSSSTLSKLKLGALQLIASLTILSGSISAQEFTLTEVLFEGSERYSTEEFLEAARLEVGEAVTVKDLELAAQRLSRLGLFKFVRFDYHTLRGNIGITFRVADIASTLMRPLKFGNFIWFSDDELLAQLTERVPMFDGTAPSSGEQLEKITLALDRILTERGIHAAVQYTLGFPRPGAPVETMWHEFMVSNVSMPVAAIRFTGANNFPVAVLDAEAQRLVGKEFNRPVLEGFASRQILPLLQQRGMIRATIGEPALTMLGPVEDTFPVEVSFRIVEGPVFTIRAFEWEGVASVPLSNLKKYITLDPGDPANRHQLRDDLDKIIRELYSRRGYLDARAENVANIHDDVQGVNEVTLTIKLNEGEQFNFEQVIFRGIPRKLQEWLDKKWKLKRGAPYDVLYPGEFMKNVAPRILGRAGMGPSSVKIELERNVRERTVSVIVTFIATGATTPTD